MFIDSEVYKLPDKWLWNKAWQRKSIFHLEARASYPAGKDACETKIVSAKSGVLDVAYKEILYKIANKKWKIIVT